MLKKTLVLVTLSATAFMAAAPAMAYDGRRVEAPRHVSYERNAHRYTPVRYVAPAPRAVVVERTVVAPRPAAVVYARPSGADIFGGLVLGTILGVAIATH